MSSRITFLDLPREIRDQIYQYLLISPTRHIVAIYPKSDTSTTDSPSPSTKFLKKPAKSQLLVTAWSPLHDQMTKPYILPQDHYTLPSTSICRVNQQIYHETNDMFYDNNALFFPHPFNSTRSFPSTLRVLKAINQTPSRLLQTIVLVLRTPGNSYKFFRKVLQALASRARHGQFKKLILHIPIKTLHYFNSGRTTAHAGFSDELSIRWEDMINAFVDLGGRQCKYEREVVIRGQLHEMYLSMAREVAKDINQALGGKLYWNDKLGYFDGEHVADPNVFMTHPVAVLDQMASATASLSALQLT